MEIAGLKTPGEHDLEALEEKITSLHEYRQGLIKQLKKCRQDRSILKQESHELSAKIKSERAAIDQMYRQLESVGQMRREMLARIREIKGRILETRRRVEGIDVGGGKETVEEASEDLRILEWKLQTERLKRDEEKRLIDQIKKTEVRLRHLQKAQAFREEVNNLLSEIRTLKARLDEVNTLKQNVEPQLQALRNRLIETVKMRDQLRKEIEGVDLDIGELEEDLKRVDGEISDLRKSRRRIIEAKRAAEFEAVKRKEAELLDQVKKEVKAKIAEGRKVTFDEWLLAFREDGDEALK